MQQFLLDKGVFILSLDTELAWGSAHGSNLSQRLNLFRETRTCIDRLINLLEKYQIHATWAMVGHLFLDQCQAIKGIKHPEIIRPQYLWHTLDWFVNDPCTSLTEDPIWYGLDIVKKILNCSIKQEIGCHSFSHVRVGEPGCSREVFLSEIHACQEEARKLKIDLKSFVFPRNSIAFIDVLANTGFLAYRGIFRQFDSHLPNVLAKIYRIFDQFVPIPPPVVLPKKDHRIWNIPASYFFPITNQSILKIARIPRKWKILNGIRKAKDTRRIFHLWFHPFNLALNPNKLLSDLECIFQEVYRLRDSGKLENLTMGEMAERLQVKTES